MSMIPQLEAIISYTLSQWIYRWLPLPQLESTLLPGVDLSQLTIDNWFQYIDHRLRGTCFDAKWLWHLRERPLSTLALATLIFDNIQKTTAAGAVLIDFYHPAYPPLLACINDPPNCLIGLGSIELLNRPSIALVGSRKASSFALRETEDLAASLAAEGSVIVSGGAIGCDIASHRGALRSGIRPCPTLIVMAGGLTRCYPRCNAFVFEQLLKAGALFLSERLWDYPARPFDFPVRNRIIAGLTPRLLLMQAGERSGAKLTARTALDQGREVFTLVHPAHDIRALGSQQLLAEGATPFFSAQDYLRLAWPSDASVRS